MTIEAGFRVSGLFSARYLEQGTKGIWLKITATTSTHTIEFIDGLTQDFVITSGQVLLGGMPVISAPRIAVTGKAVAGQPVIFLK